MSADFIDIKDSDFEIKIKDATGLVFLYKKLCPHCKALRTVIEKFVAAAEGNVPVMQIDSEENPKAMATMEVEKVPCVLIVKNGDIVARKVGLMNLRELTAFYDSA